MPLRPSTYTYADLSQNVKRVFGDESGVQLTDPDITRWVNEGLIAIVSANKILRTKSTTSTVAEQADYDFPGINIYEMSSIEVDNTLLTFMPFEAAEGFLSSNDPDRAEIGKPRYWTLWDSSFTIWPKPDAVYPLTIRYVRVPVRVTGDTSQVLDIPDKYYTALVDFVLAKCYEMDEDWTGSQAKTQAFEAAIASKGQEERNAQEMNNPVIRDVEYLY